MTGRARVRIVAGPFHPGLEVSLRDHLETPPARSRPGALPSSAIVVPSREMRRSLKLRMTVDWGKTWIGVHLMTAHDLARRIALESDPLPLQTAGELLLVELVREIVLERGFPDAWLRLVQTAGGAAALRRSLRDLEEARVPRAPESDDPLLRLYGLFQEEREGRGFGTTTDAAESAIAGADRSGFLRSLDRVAYYGFYDMTQVQLDLLERVASVRPTTIFLPCAPGRRAYEFANRFLEALKDRFPGAEIVEPAGEGEDAPLLGPILPFLFSDGGGETRGGFDGSRLAAFTGSGPASELEIAAKEILRWTEEGVAFRRIGVVARHLTPYLPHLAAVFQAHAIPFRTPEARPLTRLPWVQALLSLCRVLADDFLRADVLELLASPFFRAGGADAPIGETARQVARRLNLQSGREAWEKAAFFPHRKMTEGGGDGVSLLPKASYARFQAGLRGVLRAAGAFPPSGTWRDMAEAFRRLTGGVLDLPAGSTASGSSQATALEMLDDVLREVAEREKLGRTGATDARFFLLALAEHLHAREVPAQDSDNPGVEILSAMDARGKGFEALVILGLEEGVWPWRAPEDPFLTDGDRKRIAGGYRVRLLEKSSGNEEEKLLFALALESATRWVTLIWQRSGEDGRPLVRSWFAHELARAAGHAGGVFPGTRPVPRGLGERCAPPCFREMDWTPAEWTSWLSLRGRNAEGLHAVRSLRPGVLERCFEAGHQVGRIGPHLTERDGILGKHPELWRELLGRGVSPTALETYALCPFRYFSGHVLGLEELDAPEAGREIPNTDLGILVHDILRRFFSAWARDNTAGRERLLSEAMEEGLRRFETRVPTGYPLVWEKTREAIRRLVEGYVREETTLLEASGFRPVSFEQSGEVESPDLPAARSALRGVRLGGRLDRVDRRDTETGPELRVVDYKFTQGKTPVRPKLLETALRGQRLQPPFYAWMARERENGARADAELHFLAPHWPEGKERRFAFPGDAWETAWAAEMGETLKALLSGIRRGEFFIIPDDGNFSHCAGCAYRGLCRKNHRPTRYRRAADPVTHRVESLSDKKWDEKT